MQIKCLTEKNQIDEIVELHMKSFEGFFLTFLGRGFLKQLYSGFVDHNSSGLIVAENDDSVCGFLAYSYDLSGFYKYLIKKKLVSFAWYAGCAFLRNPKIMLRLLRAFTYSDEAKRDDKYIELSSIGVNPDTENNGVGSRLIDELKSITEGSGCKYIKLETDAVNNEKANGFYIKNGFVLDHTYKTHEGREMNEYRYYFD